MSKLFDLLLGVIVALALAPFIVLRWAWKQCNAGVRYVIDGIMFDINKPQTVTPSVDVKQAETEVLQPASPVATQQARTSLIEPGPQERRTATRGGIAADHVFKIADFHVQIVFNNDFGGTVSVYGADNLVRRKIRAKSQAAATLMLNVYQSETFSLPDLQLTNELSTDMAIVQTEQDGIAFLEELLSPKDPSFFEAANKRLPNTFDLPRPIEPDSAVFALAVLRGEAVAPTEPAKEMSRTTASSAEANNTAGGTISQAKRASKGSVTGKVVELGMRNSLFGGWNKGGGQSGVRKEAGQVFETTIEMYDGTKVSRRGVRLQELFAENEIRLGDMVEIEMLEGTQVNHGENRGMRNEYKLRVLERSP